MRPSASNCRGRHERRNSKRRIDDRIRTAGSVRGNNAAADFIGVGVRHVGLPGHERAPIRQRHDRRRLILVAERNRADQEIGTDRIAVRIEKASADIEAGIAEVLRRDPGDQDPSVGENCLRGVQLFVAVGGVDGEFGSDDRHDYALQANATGPRLRASSVVMLMWCVVAGGRRSGTVRASSQTRTSMIADRSVSCVRISPNVRPSPQRGQRRTTIFGRRTRHAARSR
jgi:hypothetical protein